MEPVTDAQSATNTLAATIMGGGNSSGGGGGTSAHHHHATTLLNPKAEATSPMSGDAHANLSGSMATSKEDEEDSSNAASSDCKSPGQRYVNVNLL